MVTMVLLAMIAIGYMAITYPRASFYDINEANHIGDMKIELYRNYTDFAALKTALSSTVTGTQTVNGTTYTWNVSSTGYDVGTITSGGTLTGALTADNTSPQILMITVTVYSGASLMATRTAFVAQ